VPGIQPPLIAQLDVANFLVPDFGQGRTEAVRNASAAGRPDDDPALTTTEREILNLVVRGQTNKQIAQSRFVTEATVKFHLRNVFQKIGVSNRTEATIWAIRNRYFG
jgi:DNA-binding NarL/FixJ family response regulator